MTAELALLLAQDGIANGAIYVLVALGIVLVFQVTRIVFVPFGDLVAYASLSLTAIQTGALPGLVWLILPLAALATLAETVTLLRRAEPRRLPRAILLYAVLPAAPVLAAIAMAGHRAPDWLGIPLTVALVLPVAPLLYRLAFRPIAEASVLVLLMVSVVVHFAMSGVALMAFGPEGARPTPLTDANFTLGDTMVSGQLVLILTAASLAALLLAGLFGLTLTGRALRATAINRTGARLVGIRPAGAATTSFLLASALAAISGILIGPVATLFYDSGFVIGLKAFVGAIIGGLVSYPGAALGALFVGLLESFTAFWNSALKDVVVFAALVPVLMLRSALTRGETTDEGEDEL